MKENLVACPGCGVKLPRQNLEPSDRYHASGECMAFCYELTARTLNRGDAGFIHQLAVDAYCAQHSGVMTKTIGTAFALIGLCLVCEYGYNGREVQLVHMRIPKQHWERLEPPHSIDEVTVCDVMQATSDEELDNLIHKWVNSVWERWVDHHNWVRARVAELIGR